MNFELKKNSLRSKRAKLADHISLGTWKTVAALGILVGIAGFLLFLQDDWRRLGYLFLALALLSLILDLWYKRDLANLPPSNPARTLDDIIEPKLLAALLKVETVTPKTAWKAVEATWAGRFMGNHLMLPRVDVELLLENDETTMQQVWVNAHSLVAEKPGGMIDGAALCFSLLANSEHAKKYLVSQNLKIEEVQEVYGWFARFNDFINRPKPYFGGIGRDWASGFTPTLDVFGQNLSRTIEAGAGHFHTLAHADVLDAVVHNLSQGSGGVAIVGEVGTGKTSLAYALAQRLLEGRDQDLRYNQIISLDASRMISSAHKQMERLILNLFGEAAQAGNIILFLDEASLFFGEGTGAFDISQVLLPVLQNRSIKIVAAFTPSDYQALKNSNASLANTFAAVNINEPDEATTMDILEDTALGIEATDGVLVTYEAVREAYRLSGQYNQDLSYPGKAIKILEQSIAYADNKLMSASSVQAAVEKTQGVKVAKAEAPEADMLLHLEDRIHERMINQERAVKAVANALRRGRAGVNSPNRPIGSFLFLGPTGVGKTELARSLAATYFGDEKQMIRLDMSEYQQPGDVSRLLDSGSTSNKSLIMSIREQPFSVVLLDEIEKAHPNILNLLLQMLDEGQLSDQVSKPASFKNSIIITTSNAGSAEITARVGSGGESLDNFERPLIEKLIAGGLFKPELINRFDEVVLFRPLNETELTQVAKLMINSVNETLSNQNVKVELTEPALALLVKSGYDPEFGARPMRRVIQKTVENAVANKLLSKEAQAGSTITLDEKDLS
jgi:ATP-dependent Clp protease ATP-binding subunit ClpC